MPVVERVSDCAMKSTGRNNGAHLDLRDKVRDGVPAETGRGAVLIRVAHDRAGKNA